MARIVHPPVAEHSMLRQPLTRGELAVLELFDRALPLEWEIYIQPHLNGLRPDFVLLNPSVGVAVFEVKDWDLDAMRYFTQERGGGRPELWAERSGKAFSLQSENPVTKVNRYKEEIQNLYCPRLGQKDGWAAVTAGVIFPFADRARVRDLLSPFLRSQDGDSRERYQPISGAAQVQGGRLDLVFPESTRRRSVIMSEHLASDLRGWLAEPDFSAAQRRPLELDRAQKLLSETRTESGYRRIRGSAGSGKSLVLAARAARLASEGKSVLVATFNITLWHYLKDLVVRGVSSRGAMGNITFTHFHHWCRRVCGQVGWDNEYAALFDALPKPVTPAALADRRRRLAAIMETDLPGLAREAAMLPDASRYDAILVDEGQDYRLPWWNALREVLNAGGEMVLVADSTQDVYGTARAWTEEAMHGAGFAGGRWATLDFSYRLPLAANEMVRSFAEQYLPGDTRILPKPPQAKLDLDPCELRWVQCTPEAAARVSAEECVRLMHQTGRSGLANADITFLSESIAVGRSVALLLQTRGIRSVDTYAEQEQKRRLQKMSFYMGVASIKATTLHSFKGWETRLLVVHIDQAKGPENLALIYAGLTRIKRSAVGSWLTVVCSAPELLDFGKSWPDFSESTTAPWTADRAPAPCT